MQNGRKMKLKISAQAAAFLNGETPREEKLKAARGEIPLDPSDLVAVLSYLSRDSDSELKDFSVRSLKGLGEHILSAVCSKADTHPVILDKLARIHCKNSSVTGQIVLHPNTDRNTLLFLAEYGVKAAQMLLDTPGQDVTDTKNTAQETTTVVTPVPSETGETEKENGEFKSKFQLAQDLGIKEKMKLALTGDKEWRSLLIKDNNRLITESVLKNPRITEQEILLICKSSVNNDEILRFICTDKEWTKNYQIRKALIENHRTPLHHALRFLSFLSEKDLAFLAKSKNVSSVITNQARRMLINKNSGK